MFAEIAAGEEAAAKALRTWTLRQSLRFGVPSAVAVLLFLDVLETEGPGLDVWIQTIASISTDPVANVAMAALAALGLVSLVAGVVVGPPFVARRLRSLGLL
jgi:hypothetical protein